jgi:hypothetical protein
VLRIVGVPIAVPTAFVNVVYVALHNFLDKGAASAIVQCNMMALPRVPLRMLAGDANRVAKRNFLE